MNHLRLISQKRYWSVNAHCNIFSDYPFRLFGKFCMEVLQNESTASFCLQLSPAFESGKNISSKIEASASTLIKQSLKILFLFMSEHRFVLLTSKPDLGVRETFKWFRGARFKFLVKKNIEKSRICLSKVWRFSFCLWHQYFFIF